MRLTALVFCFLLSVAFAQGQKGSQTSSSSSSQSSGGGGGGGGSATIEEEAIAYEGVSQISGAIVTDVENNLVSSSGEDKKRGCTAPVKAILFVDSNSTATSEIAAYYSFNTTALSLKQSYENLSVPGGALAAPSPTDWITAAVGLLSALRANAVFSGQTFQPDDTVLITELTKRFKARNGYALVSSLLPGDLNKAAGDISDLIKSISDARAKVPKPAQQSYFDSLDKQFAALVSGLVTGTGVVGNPTAPTGGTLLMSIISGKALVNSLNAESAGTTTTCYAQLFAKTVAAGGSSRTNHNFWVELVYTTPKPSYNGGAIVSYSLLSSSGTYLTGGTLRTVFDYSKWKAGKVTSPKNY